MASVGDQGCIRPRSGGDHGGTSYRGLHHGGLESDLCARGIMTMVVGLRQQAMNHTYRCEHDSLDVIFLMVSATFLHKLSLKLFL
jgi:hypothetical protein